MGSLFSPDKPDTSALRAQEAAARKREQELAAQEKKAKEEEERRKKAQISARRGGSASLVRGMQTGVSPVTEKRETIG